MRNSKSNHFKIYFHENKLNLSKHEIREIWGIREIIIIPQKEKIDITFKQIGNKTVEKCSEMNSINT